MAADRDIVRLCQQGRPEGFALLLEEYQGKVYRRAYSFLRHREDALDVTQEVFLRAARAIGHFQSDRPLWPWLRQVTTRACLNYIRDHRQGPPTVSLDDVQAQGEPAAAEGDPEQRALLAWDRAMLEQALASLPTVQRMVVVLRHQEHLSYGEIAQLLDLPLGTVKTYLFRARQALIKAMQQGAVD